MRFGCSNLRGNLTIPYKVSFIGSCAFYGCSNFGPKLKKKNRNRINSSFSNDLFDANEGGIFVHIGKYAFNNTHFKTLYYDGYVEPSYEYPISLNEDVIIKVSSENSDYNYPFYYRGPCFCSHSIINSVQSSPSYVPEIRYDASKTLEFYDLDDYQKSFKEKYEKIQADTDGKRKMELNYNKLPSGTHISIPDYLKENDYIQYGGSDIIYYDGKPFNIHMSSLTTNVQIKGEQPSNIAINSQNGGTLSLTTDQTSVELDSSSTIESQFNSNPFKIKVPSYVDSVTMKELTLNRGKVNVLQKIDDTTSKHLILEVKNLTTNSQPKLEYMKINGPFNVKQTSKVELGDNVTLDNAGINLQLSQLNANLSSNGLFTGKVDSIPSKFTVSVAEDTVNISEISNITIFRGMFKQIKCKDWASRLADYPSKYFSKPDCRDTIQSASILDGEEDEDIISELILPKNENYVNDFGKLTCKDNKLSGGAIAGIVIACIVAVVKNILSEKEAEEV
ncbi:hypothetical protein M9Y10_037334 [Tritrichomonas musculus]|uniref:Uncharacterized protein n=1 Tax=Tritrichomonas musculus TaxID=1915356 RepID=A0ABR2GT28_9EUKA